MRALAFLVALVALVSWAASARAEDDPATYFTQATQALKEGRAGDAIASLEALADRGVVDPVASYDRGLAYAMRVRIGAEVPGSRRRAISPATRASRTTRRMRSPWSAPRLPGGGHAPVSPSRWIPVGPWYEPSRPCCPRTRGPRWPSVRRPCSPWLSSCAGSRARLDGEWPAGSRRAWRPRRSRCRSP
jgi:hypothetical protein